jgi:integrating conjugative element protein (TIGR03761 family)
MKRAQQLKQRSYAERIVPDNEALGIRTIGGLVQEENDEMFIHTKEAYRLFIGRTRDDSPSSYGISSAKKIAAILRSVWNLSSNDNPYADWMLIQFTDQIDEVRKALERATQVHQATLDTLEKRGLVVHVMKSRAPIKVNLGFRSPYGYMVAEMLVDFDWYTRLIKTMIAKSRVSDEVGRADLNKFRSRIRSIFESALPFQKYLLREELRALS